MGDVFSLRTMIIMPTPTHIDLRKNDKHTTIKSMETPIVGVCVMQAYVARPMRPMNP
jgi:hypothetical protein